MKDQIFYSQDEEPYFQVVQAQSLGSLSAEEEAYITSMIDSRILSHEQSPIKQLKFDEECKPQKVPKIKKSKVIQPSQTSISVQMSESKVSDDLDSNQDQESQFKLDFGQSPPKNKKKKPRVSDQNICKKYHSLANKSLRKLGLYKNISPYVEKIHKRNYFLIALMIAEKHKKLNQFMEIYYEKVEQSILSCQKIIKGSFNGSKQVKRSKQLKKSIINSLQAMEIYGDGKILQSLQKLYDLERMKRSDWVKQSYSEVLKIGQTIQIN